MDSQRGAFYASCAILALFFVVQIVFLIVLSSILIWLIVKQFVLYKQRRKHNGYLEKSEVRSFAKRLVFILLAIPMPIIGISLEIFIVLLYISIAVGSNTLLSVFFVLYCLCGSLCSAYLVLLLIYVSFLLIGTVYQLKRSSITEYRVQIALLVISMLLYAFFMIATGTFGGISVAIYTFRTSYTRQDLSGVASAMLAASGISFWISYFICVVVLGLGLRFYFVVASLSRKTSNQILVFLCVLIVSSLIQSLGNLVLNFVFLDSSLTIVLLIYFLMQRISEAVFLFALILLFVPIHSVVSFSKKVTTKVIQQAEKIADDIIGTNKKKVVEEEGGSDVSCSAGPSSSSPTSVSSQLDINLIPVQMNHVS